MTTLEPPPRHQAQDARRTSVAENPDIFEIQAMTFETFGKLLLCDALKVAGGDYLSAPVADIFFTNPDSGGTGLTMRICRAKGVPAITHCDWLGWDLFKTSRLIV